MAKDPAFLFYPNDYIGGTMGMTFEEKGAYIELLMLQFNRGHMTSHMIGQTVGQLWDNIKDKFIQDDKGLWYNERLDLEKEKRKRFTDSRKNNLEGKNQYTKKSGHKTSHKENEDSIHNVDNSISNKLNKSIEYYKKESEEFKNENYRILVGFLLGDNEINEPLEKCLLMNHPINRNNFKKLLDKSIDTKRKLTATILALENDQRQKNPKKRYSSFSMTVSNWLENSRK